MSNSLNESLPPAPVKTDPWEERIALAASNKTTVLDEPKSESAANLSAGDWYRINTLRQFFTKRFALAYEKRLPKDECLHAFEEKRLFEHILTLFLGGEKEMKVAQDRLIRSLEREHRYVIRSIHSTLTSAPLDPGDYIMNYEYMNGEYDFL
jgi:hypothetical protein